MITERDPFYWESLKELDGGDLKNALQECADNSLVWAIDQARILYYNTKPHSPQARIVVDFCLANAEHAAAEEPTAGLQAWQLASSDEAADPDKAAQSFRKILDQIAHSDLHRAWDLAVVTLGSTEKYNPVHAEAVSFLAEQGEDPHGLLAKSLSREFGDMAEADLEKIVNRMEILADREPYRAVNILREIVESNTFKGRAVSETARLLMEKIKEDPLFSEQLLQEEHEVTLPQITEINASSQPRSCDLHPQPSMLQ